MRSGRSNPSHGVLTFVSVHRRIQEITTKIEEIREKCKLLQIVSSGNIEEKLSGFVKELKQQVDGTQVLSFPQRTQQPSLVADEGHISSQWSWPHTLV